MRAGKTPPVAAVGLAFFLPLGCSGPPQRPGTDGGADATASPAFWSPNVRIDDDPGSLDKFEVSLAVDARGNWYATWIDASKGGCTYAGSTDGGRTWSRNEGYPGPFGACGDPVVAADKKGNLYRLGTSVGADRDGVPNRSELDVSRSVDGGRSFGPWQTAVPANPAPTTAPSGLNDKPWMAADGDLVVVVWSVLERFGLGDVTFIKSTDGGATWAGRRVLGRGIGACIAIDGRGTIHAGWSNGFTYPQQSAPVSYTASEDQGVSWRIAQSIGTGGIGTDAQLFSAPIPGCAVDDAGDHVYWVWAGDTGGGSEDVWVAHSEDGGQTWDPQIRANDNINNARQSWPWIAVDPLGGVHAAWIDWRNGNPEAYYASSSDHGRTWALNQRISDHAGPAGPYLGDYTNIAVSPAGYVGYAWTDSRIRGNQGNIFFSSTNWRP